jgi:hypothetical protein
MRTLQDFLLAGTLAASLLVSAAAGQTRFQTISTFASTNPLGLTPSGSSLYGAAFAFVINQPSCGSIFQLQPPASPGGAWTQATLFTFESSGSGGCPPGGPPIVGPGGRLYGTMVYGGTYDDGVLYELQPPSAPGGAWTESVLYSFNLSGIGTGYPEPPVPGPNGSFYCTASGGLYGSGALVQLQPPSVPGGTWTQTVLYNFYFGLAPGPLVPGPGGVLYGTNWGGAIIQLTPPAAPGGSWTETVLYTLTSSDGLSPNSLTLASDGTLYGTALGSSYGYGIGKATVFQLTPPPSGGGAWSFTLLQNFGENVNLNSPLILRNGNLYGTADSFTGGQVFELQPPATPGGAWTRVPLHQFSGNQLPGGTLVMDQRGGLFGVTAAPYLQPPNGTVYWLATNAQARF